MTLEEEMDGWTYDSTLKEWSYHFLRYVYADDAKTTSSVIVGFDGVRVEDGHERGRDYESYVVTPGRYNHAVACFNASVNPGYQRLWWLALDTMGGLYAESTAGMLHGVGRAWELKLIDMESLIARYYAFSEGGGIVFPMHRLEEIMYIVMCSACWTMDEDTTDSEYIDGYENMVVNMIKQLHPEAAHGLELFRWQIGQALPAFKFNEPGARAYVYGLVRGLGETFDLPDLE